MNNFETRDGFAALNGLATQLKEWGPALYSFSPYVPDVAPAERSWAGKEARITQDRMPILCEVGLRDGNQSLRKPMSVEQKLEYFEFLQNMGFNEIEVGYPAASETDREFLRRLITEKRIRDDVTIQVLTATRPDLLQTTFENILGAKNVIVHIYNSTSEAQREYVFKKGSESDAEVRSKVKDLAVNATKIVKEFATKFQGNLRFQYSPESFTGTELKFALEICSAVIETWGPTAEHKMILNLPATVEMTTPDEYADYIEWMIKRIPRRDSVIVSVHNHNDRGCAVAAAELAVKAGADRVEGTLFGNGERTGNMDLITFCGNRLADGVDPGVNYRMFYAARDVYERCTGMSISPRQPYAGELVFTAFAGTHQDAIRKGLIGYRENAATNGDNATHWDIPYVPVFPGSLGFPKYSFVQVNAQSGKAGVRYELEDSFGIVIPKGLEAEFGLLVKQTADKAGTDMPAQQIKDLLLKTYAEVSGEFQLERCSVNDTSGGNHSVILKLSGFEEVSEIGNGPVSAANAGLRQILGDGRHVESFSEQSLGTGDRAKAISYIALRDEKTETITWGIGISDSVGEAPIRALIAAHVRLNARLADAAGERRQNVAAA